MKKMNVLYVAIITILLVAFNNCGQFAANSDKKSDDSTSLSSSGGCNPISTFSPICTPHSPGQLGINTKLTFQVDLSKVNVEDRKNLYKSSFYWDHQLNGNAQSCSMSTEINGDIAHFECPEAGQLIIDVVVDIPDLGEIRYVVQVEILEEAEAIVPKEEVEDEGGMDGFPSPGDGDMPKMLSGAELYEVNCQGCHGNLNNTQKRGRSANQIKNAIIGNVGGMGSLSGLSNTELQAIADALGM